VSATGSNSIHSVKCVSAANGLHDETEHVECTLEEVQTISFVAAPTDNFSELHGFFFDPDDDTISSQVPPTRRTVLRSSRLSTVQFFAIAFGLWQASLIPNGSVIKWTKLPQRSFPAVDYHAFGRDWNSPPVGNSQRTVSSWGSWWGISWESWWG